jgi:FAD/FMN-containing dehydrogenase
MQNPTSSLSSSWAQNETALSLQDILILSDHDDYEKTRGVWNAAIDAFPEAVISCRNAEDVSKAVHLANENGLPVAVRSGGHSPAGYGTLHAGLVIDLSPMKGIEVDVANKTARIEPGLTWAEVSHHLNEHGLALTAGDVASVGVGGLALGGGIGWMAAKHGLTIDRLRAVELVTADGKQIRASHDENQELFWGLRGGGGNFGIATAFEFDVHEGGLIYGGAIFFEGTNAAELMHAYSELALQAPDELTTQMIMIAAPPAPFIPSHAIGQPVVGILMCHCGSFEQAEKDAAPYRELGNVVADLLGQMPYPALFQLSEVGTFRGLRHDCRSMFLNDLSPELADTVMDEALKILSPGMMLQLRTITGEARRVPADATAYSHRDKPFLLMVDCFCPQPEGDVKIKSELDALWAKIQSHETGSYANFLGLHETHKLQSSFSTETQKRLVNLKRQYDPQNLFRHNTNFCPKTKFEA